MKLKEFVKGNGIEVNKMAKALGIDRVYLWQLMNNKRKASVDLAKKIEAVTIGAVTAIEVLDLTP